VSLRSLAHAVTSVIAVALALPSASLAADGDYIVVFDEGVDAGRATAALERSDGIRAAHRYGAALRGFASHLSDQQRERLLADPAVSYIVADTPVHGTGLAPVATKETVPAGIRRIRAATATQANAASDAGVAVIDTGLDLRSADLNAVSGTNCVTPGAAAQDDNGHGTHIGGTIAGRNTGSGVVGVAPGTRLHAVKVLNAKASGSLSTLLCGIDWVTRNAEALGIRVVNMSISGPGSNDDACGRANGDALHQAICASVAAGITYVVSAGNSNADIASVVPASYPEVLTVTAATDTDGLPGAKGPAPCARGEKDDTPWSSSNYASTAHDAAHVVAAPGVCVVSTKRSSGTTTMTGTSMATPHVAGTVAQCLRAGATPGPCASETPAQIVQRIRVDAEAAARAGWGFAGDPMRPISAKTYGFLVSAAGY
jgi:subtilisin